MRVGVIDDPPFAAFVGGEAVGVEPALVRELANELNTRIAWVPGAAPDLLEALEKRELELVIGGLTVTTPWSHKLSLTAPFYTDSLVVGLPPGAAPIARLEGREVAVELGDAAAAYLRGKDAVPIFVRRLEEAQGLVAAPEWKLSSLGRASSGIVLHQSRHVWALPRGENGWLVRLEQFLRRWKPRVPHLLRQEAAG